MVAGFVVVTIVVLDFVVGSFVVIVGALVVVGFDSHLTLAAQSQYLNCELKSNPLGHDLM